LKLNRLPSTTEIVTIKDRVGITAEAMSKEVDMREEDTNPEAEEAAEDVEAAAVDLEGATKTDTRMRWLAMTAMVRVRLTSTEEDHLAADTNIVEDTKEAVNILTRKLDTTAMKRISTNPSLILRSNSHRMRYRTKTISAPRSSGLKK